MYTGKMPRTRRSLYYLATYLLLGGMALLLAPQLALTLLFRNGHNGDVMPRLVGVVLFIALLGLVRLGFVRTGASYVLDRRWLD